MTAVIRAGSGLRLCLPGRKVTELVSAAMGGYRVTVRKVTIPPEGGRPDRGPHRHDCEEVIAVVAGHGQFVSGQRSVPVGPGDVIVVTPGEAHLTRNTGQSDLVSLCFFPVGDLAQVTAEIPEAGR